MGSSTGRGGAASRAAARRGANQKSPNRAKGRYISRPMSEDSATCPVCGAAVPIAPRTPSVGFRGRRWFFCSAQERPCIFAFKKAPERFADAHPEAGVAPPPPPVPPAAPRDSPFTILRGPLPDEPDAAE